MRCEIHGEPNPCRSCAAVSDFAESFRGPIPKTAKGADGMWLLTDCRVVTPGGRVGRIESQETAGDYCRVKFRDGTSERFASSELRRAAKRGRAA